MLIYIILLSISIQPSFEVTYPCNSSDTCGCSRNPASAGRIVGGESASSGTWGWVVSISIANNILCGGTIISNSWILTAAHCVNRYSALEVTIYAGSISRWSGTQTRVASQIIIHMNFNSKTFVNDIALLQLSSSLSMEDPFVSQICLPSVDSTLLAAGEWPPADTYVTVVGWGRLSSDNSYLPSSIQQATVQIVDRQASTCSPLINDSNVQLCAGGGGKDTCQGDSGGPAIIYTTSKQWVLIGVTSNGIGCADPNYMGVYTRVSAFENWIRSNTNNSFSTPRNLTASNIHPPNTALSIIISTSNNYLFLFALSLCFVQHFFSSYSLI